MDGSLTPAVPSKGNNAFISGWSSLIYDRLHILVSMLLVDSNNCC